MNGRIWTSDEDSAIRPLALGRIMTGAEASALAAQFGRGKHAIQARATYLRKLNSASLLPHVPFDAKPRVEPERPIRPRPCSLCRCMHTPDHRLTFTCRRCAGYRK